MRLQSCLNEALRLAVCVEVRQEMWSSFASASVSPDERSFSVPSCAALLSFLGADFFGCVDKGGPLMRHQLRPLSAGRLITSHAQPCKRVHQVHHLLRVMTRDREGNGKTGVRDDELGGRENITLRRFVK